MEPTSGEHSKPVRKKSVQGAGANKRKDGHPGHQAAGTRPWSGWKLWFGLLLTAYLGGILTVVATLLFVYPWVVISDPVSTSEHNPFALSFRLENDGYWAIDELRVRCRVFTVEPGNMNRIVETGVEAVEDLLFGLKPKHVAVAGCQPEVPDAAMARHAALTISVSYRRDWIPGLLRREEPEFVYSLQRSGNSGVQWIPKG